MNDADRAKLTDDLGDYIDAQIGPNVGYALILTSGEPDSQGRTPINYRGNMINEVATQVLDMVSEDLDGKPDVPHPATH